jgi:hypothetical protein
MPHPPWWCLRRIACQVLELSPAPMDAPLRARRAQGDWASWYGSGLYGRPTASGEPCSWHDFTAPYCTLLLGTQVLVHHLETDAQVEGKIIACRPSVDSEPCMDMHERRRPW